jgi:hypothetical protein
MTALAALVGCKVELFPNNYFKNEGVYEYSLFAFENITFMKSGWPSIETAVARNTIALSSAGSMREETVPQQSAQPGTDRLREELVTLARLRRDYFEPELVRLQNVIAEHEKTKHEWFEPELARLGAALKEADARIEHYENEVARLQSSLAEWFEPELARLGTALKEADKMGSVLRSDVERLGQEVEGARHARIQEYENEIARLRRCEIKRQLVETELIREIQDQRARVLYYAEQIHMLAAQIDPLRVRSQELERLKQECFDPEMKRLHDAIEGYEKTKREWFEPQLLQKQARTDELEKRLSSLEQFEASRSYRAWRKVQKLYEVPLLGPILRGARRVVGGLLRALLS